MKRFYLSAGAERDLDEIGDYLRAMPRKPARSIARSLQAMLRSIAAQPYLGAGHSEMTRLLGEEVRTRSARPYRIYYLASKNVPEIIAVLHGARDHASILADRFQ